jgi:hypothetical protein
LQLDRQRGHLLRVEPNHDTPSELEPAAAEQRSRNSGHDATGDTPQHQAHESAMPAYPATARQPVLPFASVDRARVTRIRQRVVFGVSLRLLSVKELEDLVADPGKARTQAHEDLGRDAFALTHQAEEYVLGPM